MTTPTPALYAELRATRRELAAARRALQEHAARRVAVGRPLTREDTARALSTVIHHVLPPALEELRAERDRLARDLGHVRLMLRAARMRYSTLRYNVWHIAHRAVDGHEPHDTALTEVVAETADSDDDRLWEEDGWAE